ncbi:MAG: hypothetical protein ABIR35_09540, partial [Polaromonas sp.]
MAILCLQDFSGRRAPPGEDPQLVSEGNTLVFGRRPVFYGISASAWLIRSSSAHTSAMRPEMTMRPAHEGLTARSNSRTTRRRLRKVDDLDTVLPLTL